MNEGKIIGGCKARDRVAQRAFVDNYSSYMFTICRRYTNNEFSAQDCLQDALIQVLTKIDQYRSDGNFKGWISRITVTKCLEYHRKARRHQVDEIVPNIEPSEESDVLFKLEADEVFTFLESIPSKYRIAINMFLVEGYSHKEIGQCLGVTESSSRSLVTRARKMIQERFKSENLNVVYKKEQSAREHALSSKSEIQ